MVQIVIMKNYPHKQIDNEFRFEKYLWWN